MRQAVKRETWRAESSSARLLLWEPAEVEVVLGRCSRLEEEVRGEALAAFPVNVRRRRGGGCAVVLCPGVLVLLFVSRGARPVYPVDWLEAASRTQAACLDRLGITGLIPQRGGDLTLGDRKVLGACLYVGRDFMEYGASLLVSPDLFLFERYLRHPPREPGYRRGRPHRDFVTSLRENGVTLTPEEIGRHLGPLLWTEWGGMA